MNRINAFRGWKEQRMAWIYIDPGVALYLILEYCGPRFRKNEGGMDKFAEGYKTFGFQRPTEGRYWQLAGALGILMFAKYQA